MSIVDVSIPAKTAASNNNQKDLAKSRRNVKLFCPPPSANLDTSWTINIYSASHERDRWEQYN